MQWVEVLSGAELAHFVHPVSGECGRTHHQRRHGAAVWGFGSGILPRPEHTFNVIKLQQSTSLASTRTPFDSAFDDVRVSLFKCFKLDGQKSKVWLQQLIVLGIDYSAD